MGWIAGLAEKISKQLKKEHIITEEDAKLYQYGIENGIVLAINIITSIMIGVVTGKLGTILVFLLFYSILRSYSGGIHCNSRWLCYVSSIGILLFPIFSEKILMDLVIEPVRNVILVFAFLVIFFLSPVESKKKQLDEEERRYFKRVSHCIAAIQGCTLVILYCKALYSYFCAGYVSIVLVAFFMILGKVSAKHDSY